jgi:CBS domain-containing protein
MKPVEEVILPTAPARKAAELLCKTVTGFLPVVELEGEELRMLGIITETDMLRAAYDPLGCRD